MQAYMSQLTEFRCRHIYKEANFVADSLAKFSHSLTAPQTYLEFQYIPKEAEAYFHLDKMNMVSFKRKKLKKIREPPYLSCLLLVSLDFSSLLLLFL